MLIVQDTILNNQILTVKGIFTKTQSILHFIFNVSVNDINDFTIETKELTPEYGMFKIDDFIVGEVSLSNEEMIELLNFSKKEIFLRNINHKTIENCLHQDIKNIVFNNQWLFEVQYIVLNEYMKDNNYKIKDILKTTDGRTHVLLV